MSDVISFLTTLDTNVFLFLNGLHNSFFDNFMFLISGKWIWIPFYVGIIYVLIKYWRKDALWMILALILCVVIADQVSSGVIKKLVERPRPSRLEELQGLVHIVNEYRGGRFGFVSSHAANTFGLAFLCSLLFRKKTYTWLLFVWAMLVSYSRIYLGVHYPLDILGGIIVGTLGAWFCYWLLKKFKPAVIGGFKMKMQTDNISERVQLYLPLWVMLLTIIGSVVFSLF